MIKLINLISISAQLLALGLGQGPHAMARAGILINLINLINSFNLIRLIRIRNQLQLIKLVEAGFECNLKLIKIIKLIK